MNAPAVIAGRYQLKRPLGEGERKKVYLARDPQLETDVAVALMSSADPIEVSVTEWEARVTAKLRHHPHIVTVFDTGQENGWSYIVSQYMAGGDLATVCQKMAAAGRQFARDRVLQIGRQVCDALVHAHEARIIHRDVQPANIWFDKPDGVAYLGDFDLAVSLDQAEPLPAELVTTCAYMPPEQALAGPVDERGDLYSFGATLYHMVAGEPPFTGSDEDEIINQHINAEPEPLSDLREDVPLALDLLVLGLLNKRPDDRPQTAVDVLAALEAIPAESTSYEYDLDDVIEQGESAHVEFKASLRYAHDAEKRADEETLELMVGKTIAGFMNSEGGTLLIGVSDGGEILGIEHDYRTFGSKGNRDAWELYFQRVMRNMLGREAAGAISLFFIEREGKTVAVTQCKSRSAETWVTPTKGEKVERFYIRCQNATEMLSTRDTVQYIRTRWR